MSLLLSTKYHAKAAGNFYSRDFSKILISVLTLFTRFPKPVLNPRHINVVLHGALEHIGHGRENQLYLYGITYNY